jgi:cold shock CspA family protein
MHERTGTVVAFDEAKGWGTVRDDTSERASEDGTGGGEERFFHCTAIADGSRTIAVGTPVRYEVVPGRQGRWEAAGLTPA